METKKVDYVKIRGIIAFIWFTAILVFPRVDRLDNYDEDIQLYIIAFGIIGALYSLYFGCKYLFRIMNIKI